MVHGLASQLGGAMRISSRLGLGTRVDLWLPAARRRSRESRDRPLWSLSRRGSGTVLLVDDEEIVRASTADMLMDLGYEVVEAESAESALRELRAGLNVDLLVTDHLMPGMNGTDLAREVRSRWPGRPVLLISGFAEAEGVAPDLPRPYQAVPARRSGVDAGELGYCKARRNRASGTRAEPVTQVGLPVARPCSGSDFP
jgi:CheY-like chemotaxis protein